MTDPNNNQTNVIYPKCGIEFLNNDFLQTHITKFHTKQKKIVTYVV